MQAKVYESMDKIIDKLIAFLEADEEEMKSSFPNNPSRLIYSNATDQEIIDFEKQFNFSLPNHLIEFYKQFNASNANIMFTEILGLPKIKKDYGSYPGLTSLVNDKFISIADYDGNYLCLDTKLDKDELYHFEHEDGSLTKTNMTINEFLLDLVKQKTEHDLKRK